MSDPFILRADGHIHSSDVRHVAFGSVIPSSAESQQVLERTRFFRNECDVVLITSSRDNTSEFSGIPVKQVEESGAIVGGDEIVAERLFVGHAAFVNFSFLHKEGLAFLDCRGPAAASSSNENYNEEAEEKQAGKEVSPGTYLVTGSNDSHVVVWGTDPVRIEAVLDGHRSGVTCGDVIQEALDKSTTNDFHGDIVTGDWAGTILIFSHQTGKVRAAYNGHENAIRGLVYLPGTSLIVSVSGDKTVHCWDYQRLVLESVNALAVTGPVSRVLRGHEDVVQCVCYVGRASTSSSSPSSVSYVATGSNDCTVRIWAVESQLRDAHAVKVLAGHDSLVYGLCFSAFTGELFSASEDHTVRVWGTKPNEETKKSSAATAAPSAVKAIEGDCFFSGFTTAQLVQHPCVVWSVASCRVLLPPTDTNSSGGYEDLLLTGSADRTVRLWTRNDENFASVEKLELLEEAIAAQKVDIKLIGSGGGGGGHPLFDLQTLPSVEALHSFKGSAEGEKKFFKNEVNEVEVYIWTNGRWDKIGVVVSENQPVSVNSKGEVVNTATGEKKKREKKFYKGKYYDYVFDVDIDGKVLQLPYNAGDSVFEAAQNFISDHSMLQDFSEEGAANAQVGGVGLVSQEHKEQIVNFLMQSIDEADVRKIPGLSSGPATGNEEREANNGPELWATAELLEAFSADGAQKKATELLAQSAPDKAAVFAGVMQAVQQLSDGSTLVEVRTTATQLGVLFAALPADKKFPATDAVRYAVAQVPQHAANFMFALRPYLTRGPVNSTGGGGLSFVYCPATDADMLVFVRLVANLIPALMTTPAAATELEATARYLHPLLLWAVTDVLPRAAAVNAASNANVRVAIAHFYLRNLSVLLRVTLGGGTDSNGQEERQALHDFKLNVGVKDEAAMLGTLTRLADGFSVVLRAMLAAHAELAPVLLQSAVTAGANTVPSASSSDNNNNSNSAGVLAVRQGLKKALAAAAPDAQAAAQSIARALRL